MKEKNLYKNDLLSYKEALFNAMQNALKTNQNAIIIGQGVTDHKGIFGTTLGLKDNFGSKRVIETPLAEECITGVCIGASLNGLYPINTHIRADFSLLAFNQIINLAAKYKYMFGGLFEIPMMIRMVVGRSWGQGAQHSQSLQSLFSHIPGLKVIMPSSAHMIEQSYDYAIKNYKNPIISIEHRLMYDLEFKKNSWSDVIGKSPLSSRKVRSGESLTILATSIMVLEAVRASEYLENYGIKCEIIDINSPSHPDEELILESIKKTKHLIIADTSWSQYGVAAEMCRLILENSINILNKPIISLGMQPAPCPTAKSLEDLFYPTVGDIVEAAIKLSYEDKYKDIPLPDEKSMADYYKSFKGPF